MLRAMLLAAGRGERMQPLTQFLPKPLMEIAGRTLIEHNIIALKKAGICEIVINVSYQAKRIIERLGDGSQFSINIIYSYEGPSPLGTGGGIYQALPFFKGQPFVVLSSDIWTHFPFASLALMNDKDAHLIMVDNPEYHLSGDYVLTEDGSLLKQGDNKLTYGNIAIIHPRLFDGFTSGYFSLVEAFDKAIAHERVTAEHYQGVWHNIGTPQQLESARKLVEEGKLKVES